MKALTRGSAALCIAWWLAASPAAAGVVRGTVHVPPPAPMAVMPSAYPGHASSLANVGPMMHGMVTDAVLWIEKVPSAADTAADDPHPKLAQKDQCFQPRVLPIAVGTTVDFPNLDPIFHNVFSASPIKRFDLGKYPRGHSKSVTFDRVGLVNVYCDIHSHMEAFVLVLPTHAFTQPGADGSFALPRLPSGRYTLHVWHPDFHEIRREVEVGSGDLALDLGW